MNDLLTNYVQRIAALPISQEDKEKIFSNFYEETQYKVVDSFLYSLTENQKKSIAEAKTDKEAARIYFSLVGQLLQEPDYKHVLEVAYTKAMTQALSEIPQF